MQEQQWIPILDYAVLRGVSTSTLRRYIKAKKVQFKIENGRYLLLADAQLSNQYAQKKTDLEPQWDPNQNKSSISVFHRVRELEDKLMRAEERIAELNMLVAIYEEKLAPSDHQ